MTTPTTPTTPTLGRPLGDTIVRTLADIRLIVKMHAHKWDPLAEECAKELIRILDTRAEIEGWDGNTGTQSASGMVGTKHPAIDRPTRRAVMPTAEDDRISQITDQAIDWIREQTDNDVLALYAKLLDAAPQNVPLLMRPPTPTTPDPDPAKTARHLRETLAVELFEFVQATAQGVHFSKR